MIMQQWMITVGILVSYLIALFIFRVAPDRPRCRLEDHPRSRGRPAMLAWSLRARMPESPRWLMSTSGTPTPRKALEKLGMEVTEDQVRDTAEELEPRASVSWSGRRCGPRA